MVKLEKSFSIVVYTHYKMNKQKQEKIFKELNNLKDKDFSFSKGNILGSMCTQPHPIAKKAYNDFLETNLGDPELFPGTKEIEQKLNNYLLNLLNAPKSSICLIGSGGTESNINSIWFMKNISGKKEIILPESAHFSFEKIKSLMGIDTVTIPLDKNFVMDVSKVCKKISKKTAGIVGIAGSTELGTIDPIQDLSDICYDENIFLHIDAAFGGFVIPFMKKIGYELPEFDFKLKGVSSISIDPHKMGCSAIPLGVLVVRNKKWLENISVDTTYISSKKQAGILATRSGGPVAAAYAVIEYFGEEGYKKIVKRCIDNTKFLMKEINDLGLQLVTKPVLNVLGIRLKNPEKVIEELTILGWKVNKMDRLSAIRIVLMPHLTKKRLQDFIPDLKKVCMKLGEI
jgi:tyrosine decarboxylase/aspartate 1-decarboxylase